MTCFGGAVTHVKPGFWRPNDTTDFVKACRISDVCLGGQFSECSEGHIGPLCDSCDGGSGYIKYGDTCKECPNALFSFVLGIGLGAVTIIYQLWFINSSRVSNTFHIAQSLEADKSKSV
mmetsp:Transcript_39069/g.34754  ORF Transcript_39069/g.34754 Transcript_39069/m.34754 type:complete len:119 (+) Transcript_39069:1561-1917(+)